MKQSLWAKTLVVFAQLVGVTAVLAQPASKQTAPIASAPAHLGRPIAAAANLGGYSSPVPRPFSASGTLIPVSYSAAQPAPAVPIASATRGMEANSPRSWPAAIHDPGASEFATDRPNTIPRAVIVPAGGKMQVEDELIPPPKSVNASRPQPLQLPGAGVRPAPNTVVVKKPQASGLAPAQPMLPPFAQAQVMPPRAFAEPSPMVCETPMCEVPCETTTCSPMMVLPEDSCCWYDENHRQLYARAEWLLWWAKGYDVPPLATTGRFFGDPALEQGGFLGQPTTQQLFGNTIDRGAMNGARFTVGYWFECEHALEVSGFFLVPPTERALFRGAQFPVLTRPFFSPNVISGTTTQLGEFGELVNFPGLTSGDLSIRSPMNLWGIEVNLRCNWCCQDFTECDSPKKGYRVDVLFGPRYLDLDEGLVIREDLIGLDVATAGAFRNSQVTVADSFSTRNQFYGAQVGLDAEWRHGRWTLGTRAKFAVGLNQQRVAIDGSQRIVNLNNGNTQSAVGGLLALNTNIGNHTREAFSMVPEVNLTVGYNLLDHVRIFGGYNFLYWSNVVRPGDQIDRTIDVTRIPNFNLPIPVDPLASPRPVVPFKNSDFWAHGLTLGLEVRY